MKGEAMKRFRYTLLEHVAELYADANMENVLLLACQHLLEPQQRMFELLLKAGLKPHNCVIVGKNYSTNSEVLKALQKMDCVVAPFSLEFNPLRSFDDWFEEKLTAFIKEQVCSRDLQAYRKIIVLDDGGYMHTVVNRLFDDVSKVVGIEQTSSGHHKILAGGIRFEFNSIARSYRKLRYETPYIGSIGYEQIARHLKKRDKRDPKILVMGLGPIGKQVAGMLFIKNDFAGYATDSASIEGFSGFHRLMQRPDRRSKLRTPEEALKSLSEFDVIIGASGSPLFSEVKQLDVFHPEVSLISMSSSGQRRKASKKPIVSRRAR
jgi:hypothetical protein